MNTLKSLLNSLALLIFWALLLTIAITGSGLIFTVMTCYLAVVFAVWIVNTVLYLR